MLFQDKMQALIVLLMIRSDLGNMLSKEHSTLQHLHAAGMIDCNYTLTDKGWETANRLANEFGELL